MNTLALIKAMSDQTRLRILKILQNGPLHVNEVLEILDMGQSRISRHLKILSDAGLIEGIRQGIRVYYQFRSDIDENPQLIEILRSFHLEPARLSQEDSSGREAALILTKYQHEDLEKVKEILKTRKNLSVEHFQSYGSEQDSLQSRYVDASFYRKEILSMLPPAAKTVIDVGSGTGALAKEAAKKTKHLICVDQSPRMLEIAKESMKDSSGKTKVEFRVGSAEHLPVRDKEADAVIASMVLHHLPEPETALSEIRRAMVAGGTLIVAELNEHQERDMHAYFADFWLGFPKARLTAMMKKSGFQIIKESKGKGRGNLECLFITAKAV